MTVETGMTMIGVYKKQEDCLPVQAPTHGRIRSVEAMDGCPEQGEQYSCFCAVQAWIPAFARNDNRSRT